MDDLVLINGNLDESLNQRQLEESQSSLRNSTPEQFANMSHVEEGQNEDSYSEIFEESPPHDNLTIKVDQPQLIRCYEEREVPVNPTSRMLSKVWTIISGCTSVWSLVILFIANIMVHASRLDRIMHVASIFPLYSLFAYIIVHMIMYAANVYFWKKCNINYARIFGFDRETDLNPKDVLVVTSVLAVLTTLCFMIHLHVKLDYEGSPIGIYIDFVPLGLLTAFLSMLICPFDVFYKSSRFFFLKCLARCICAPFCKVSFADVFVADQLASEVQALRSLEYFVCFYGLTWHMKEHKCHNIYLYNVFFIIVSVMPYWLRLLQCLRRLYEEKTRVHIYNSLKFLVTIVAIIDRTAYEITSDETCKLLALIATIHAICFNTYWDIYSDWGLFQLKSKNLFLRDRLGIKHKCIYYTVMALDAGLRLTSLQSVLRLNLYPMKGIAISCLMSFLEIFRRGVWMFFRLENEHIRLESMGIA